MSKLETSEYSVDLTKPFYFQDGKTREALELQIGILNPDQREQYGKVEDVVSRQFVEQYGNYMTETQRAYFLE